MLTFTPKAYEAPPEAFAEYKDSLRKWYEGLSVEAKKALKIRRRRKHGTGFALYGFSYFLHIYMFFRLIVSTYRFLSETFKDAKGDSLGVKVNDRSAVWKSFSPEKRAVCCLISGVYSL